MKIRYALKTAAFAVSIVLTVLSFSFAGDKAKNPPPQTFLDTINKGREVGITNADYVPQAQIPAPPTVAAASVSVKTPAETTATVVKIEPKVEAGVVPSRFKIQILASTIQDQVKKEKNTLATKSELPLVISFEAPYYKLYAGDFTQRSDAESNLAQIKALGYKDAWIVRTAAQKK
jgi:hypothetical protein